MKIGIVLSSIGVLPGYERNVSGHAQIPLRTAELLGKAGHQVHLIATCMADAKVLPEWVPGDCELHLVGDGRRRGRLTDIAQARKVNGYRPWKLARQLSDMWRLGRRLQFDLVHFFGFERTVRLAGLAKFSALGAPVVATVLGGCPRRTWLPLYRRIDQIITATETVERQWASLGLPVLRAPHGVLRDFSAELIAEHRTPQPRRRVLFWREADVLSGADLCITAFDRLAGKFPHLRFTFALRPNSQEAPGLDELVRRHENVELYRFPYPVDVSLAKLIAESLCAVFPFRELTIHPQLAVAETLAGGVPVITTPIGSLPELVHHGRSGLLTPCGDREGFIAALEELLGDEDRALQMGRNAADDFAKSWNWRIYSETLASVYAALGGAQEGGPRAGRPAFIGAKNEKSVCRIHQRGEVSL